MSVMESKSALRYTNVPAPRDMPLPQPTARIEPSKTVKLCYTLMDVAPAVGIRDLADGEYVPGDDSLEQGIDRQNDYLLDQVGCTRSGFRLLEIGCGYGRLLRKARERGARAVGVNISAEQLKYCHESGSQVYCCTYRDLWNSPSWYGQFDGVIANGTLEHWVQPEDVQSGQMNDIYRESFAIVHKMLDPDTVDARYVTTALHVKDRLNPEDLMTPWYRLPRGSSQRQFALLHQWFGGFYPVFGQLAACAQPYFALGKEVDGTLGYRIASEYRMARMKRGLLTNPKLVWGIAKSLVQHPWTTATLLQCYFIDQAWDWQFRGEVPPTTLLRQTWKRKSNGTLTPRSPTV
jgi:cyclopropane fatty-acyl-phospholipid synthase-like methyltransferase